MSPIKIIVVDDHELFRLGVCSALKQDNDVQVIAEADSGNKVLSLLENNVIPDIVLLDIIMPGLSGMETAKIIKSKYPSVSIILLSSENSENILTECVQIGIDGFLSKKDITGELFRAIHAVTNGDNFYGTTINKIMYEVLVSKKLVGNRNFGTKLSILFSERELEIISSCAKGLTSKETAEKLFISKRTVDWHRDNIFKKLGINNSHELVRYALKKGIIEL